MDLNILLPGFWEDAQYIIYHEYEALNFTVVFHKTPRPNAMGTIHSVE